MDDLTNGAHDVEPKMDVRKALEIVEMAAVHKTIQQGMDLSEFSEEHKGKMIEIAELNENHAFEYNMKRLDVSKELHSKSIDASIVNQKTVRITMICMITAFIILCVLILVFRPEYFNMFLSFVVGLIGGVGLKSLFAGLNHKPQLTIPDSDTVVNNQEDC